MSLRCSEALGSSWVEATWKELCVCQLRVWCDIGLCVWARGSSTASVNSPQIMGGGCSQKWHQRTLRPLGGGLQSAAGPVAIWWQLPVYPCAALLLLFSSIILLKKTRWIKEQLSDGAQSPSRHLLCPTTLRVTQTVSIGLGLLWATYTSTSAPSPQHRTSHRGLSQPGWHVLLKGAVRRTTSK